MSISRSIARAQVSASLLREKDLVFEGIAKIGDKVSGYHKEEGMIGGKLGSYETEADVMLLKDDGMKGSGVRESDVS